MRRRLESTEVDRPAVGGVKRLILELSRQPNLKPVAGGTMLSYAGKAMPPRQLAADLDVAYVLDGTLAQQAKTCTSPASWSTRKRMR